MASKKSDPETWIRDETYVHETAGYGENKQGVSDALAEQEKRVQLVAGYGRDAQNKSANLSVQEQYADLATLADKRLSCLKDVSQIANLEEVFGNASAVVSARATTLRKKEEETKEDDGNVNVSLARAAQGCIFAVQDNWSWISKLARCTDVHLRNAAEYHQFFHELKESDLLMRSALQKELSQLQRRDTQEDPQKLLLKIKELLTLFLHWQHKVNGLFERSKSVLPVHLRTSRLDYFRPVTSLCSYKTRQINIHEGEELTLMDNSKPLLWRVHNLQDVEAHVPSVILLIPGPDPDAIAMANRLRMQLLGLWTQYLKLLGMNILKYLMLIFKDQWSNEESAKLKAMPSEQKDALRRIMLSIEDYFSQFWSEHTDYKELTRRFSILRELLAEQGREQDRDLKWGSSFLNQLTTFDQLLGRYKDYWTQWETFKILLETSRQPEYMLFAENWEQLGFYEMSEILKKWHLGVSGSLFTAETDTITKETADTVDSAFSQEEEETAWTTQEETAETDQLMHSRQEEARKFVISDYQAAALRQHSEDVDPVTEVRELGPFPDLFPPYPRKQCHSEGSASPRSPRSYSPLPEAEDGGAIDTVQFGRKFKFKAQIVRSPHLHSYSDQVHFPIRGTMSESEIDIKTDHFDLLPQDDDVPRSVSDTALATRKSEKFEIKRGPSQKDLTGAIEEYNRKWLQQIQIASEVQSAEYGQEKHIHLLPLSQRVSMVSFADSDDSESEGSVTQSRGYPSISSVGSPFDPSSVDGPWTGQNSDGFARTSNVWTIHTRGKFDQESMKEISSDPSVISKEQLTQYDADIQTEDDLTHFADILRFIEEQRIAAMKFRGSQRTHNTETDESENDDGRYPSFVSYDSVPNDKEVPDQSALDDALVEYLSANADISQYNWSRANVTDDQKLIKHMDPSREVFPHEDGPSDSTGTEYDNVINVEVQTDEIITKYTKLITIIQQNTNIEELHEDTLFEMYASDALKADPHARDDWGQEERITKGVQTDDKLTRYTFMLQQISEEDSEKVTSEISKTGGLLFGLSETQKDATCIAKDDSFPSELSPVESQVRSDMVEDQIRHWIAQNADTVDKMVGTDTIYMDDFDGQTDDLLTHYHYLVHTCQHHLPDMGPEDEALYMLPTVPEEEEGDPESNSEEVITEESDLDDLPPPPYKQLAEREAEAQVTTAEAQEGSDPVQHDEDLTSHHQYDDTDLNEVLQILDDDTQTENDLTRYMEMRLLLERRLASVDHESQTIIKQEEAGVNTDNTELSDVEHSDVGINTDRQDHLENESQTGHDLIDNKEISMHTDVIEVASAECQFGTALVQTLNIHCQTEGSEKQHQGTNTERTQQSTTESQTEPDTSEIVLQLSKLEEAYEEHTHPSKTNEALEHDTVIAADLKNEGGVKKLEENIGDSNTEKTETESKTTCSITTTKHIVAVSRVRSETTTEAEYETDEEESDKKTQSLKTTDLSMSSKVMSITDNWTNIDPLDSGHLTLETLPLAEDTLSGCKAGDKVHAEVQFDTTDFENKMGFYLYELQTDTTGEKMVMKENIDRESTTSHEIGTETSIAETQTENEAFLYQYYLEYIRMRQAEKKIVPENEEPSFFDGADGPTEIRQDLITFEREMQTDTAFPSEKQYSLLMEKLEMYEHQIEIMRKETELNILASDKILAQNVTQMDTRDIGIKTMVPEMHCEATQTDADFMQRLREEVSVSIREEWSKQSSRRDTMPLGKESSTTDIETDSDYGIKSLGELGSHLTEKTKVVNIKQKCKKKRKVSTGTRNANGKDKHEESEEYLGDERDSFNTQASALLLVDTADKETQTYVTYQERDGTEWTLFGSSQKKTTNKKSSENLTVIESSAHQTGEDVDETDFPFKEFDMQQVDYPEIIEESASFEPVKELWDDDVETTDPSPLLTERQNLLHLRRRKKEATKSHADTQSPANTLISMPLYRKAGCCSRLLRLVLPLQVLLFLFLCFACLVPWEDDEFLCLFAYQLKDPSTTFLRYPQGSPPV